MAPKTLPAISPGSELWCSTEVDDEPNPDVVGVRVEWEIVNVDVGTAEAVPVISGESGRDRNMSTNVCIAEGLRTSEGLRQREIPVASDL